MKRVLLVPAAVALAQGPLCHKAKHGPACKTDSDCGKPEETGCVRCARNGFCTYVPAPGPSPSPPPGPDPQDGCTREDHSFDYLLLVNAWPPTTCVSMECTPEYASIQDRFTLHGLWPSRSGARAVTYPCQCTDDTFDLSAVSSIKDRLDADWPSFKPGSESFWTHEYEKHGTCCTNVTGLNTELSYFKGTLDLRDKHDLYAALAKAGIAPDDSKTYKADDIVEALKPVAGGFEPLLGCVDHSGDQLLNEVGLCFDMDLNVQKCDPGLKKVPNDEVSDCDFSRPIKIPVGKSNTTTFITI